MMQKPQILSLLVITLTMSFLVSCERNKTDTTVDQLQIPKSEVIQGNLGDQLDTFLIGKTQEGFSGAVIIVKDGDILLKKGYGLANREKNIPITSETLFNVASIAKTFTAAAVLKLEANNKLSTDDFISKHFGQFPQDKSSATIHHLLIHTAGLAVRGTPLEYDSRGEFIQSMKDAPMESLPGTQYRYTNAGYTLLAALVEEVSGQRFEMYLADHIFGPLGMSSTMYEWDTNLLTTGIAIGYRGESVEDLRPVSAEPDQWGARGAGSIVTTVGDLYRWIVALDGDVVLPTSFRKKMFTAYVRDEGYGWHVIETNQGRFVRRGGGTLEFGSSMRWFIDKKVAIIFAMNNNLGFRVPVAEGIQQIIFGERVTLK